MHAATQAGASHPAGREAHLPYALRPPIAQERLEPRPDGLVHITPKKAYTDGTIAVDMNPLSLLCRLVTSVPPPRLHTVRYAGVLSFVTLATVGYGDIVPVHPAARSLATPEAVTGPLYIAILLARLVSLAVAPGASRHPPAGPS